jgi:hypothetical protein
MSYPWKKRRPLRKAILLARSAAVSNMTGEEMKIEMEMEEYSYREADRSNEDNHEIHTPRIDDSTGKRIRYTVFEKDLIPEFEKRMLSESGCPFTLPMHFLLDGKHLVAYYDFTGFVSIEEHIQNQILNAGMDQSGPYLLKECLNLCSNILESMKGMGNYLLSPGRMKLTLDNIYANTHNNWIAFAFIPEPESEESLKERIIRIFKEIQKLYHNQEVDQQFYRFIEIVRRKNLGINGMISLLATIQRDVTYIYWKGKDLRRLEESGDHEIQVREIEPVLQLKKADDIIQKKIWKGPAGKSQNHEKQKVLPVKLILSQILLFLILAGIYFIGRPEMTEFAGSIIVILGIDLLMIRKKTNKKPDVLSG